MSAVGKIDNDPTPAVHYSLFFFSVFYFFPFFKYFSSFFLFSKTYSVAAERQDI